MNRMSTNEKSACDAIIIGAGPAGSTAAALLAEKGRRVLVIEKEKFPRYHIGESLMPFCWFTLDRLGVLGEMVDHVSLLGADLLGRRESAEISG